MAKVRLFEHSNITGRQLLIASPYPVRYLLATSSFLNDFEFNDITSSIRLNADPGDVFHTCILFENDRFGGKFKAYAFNKTKNIISLPYYNDLTSSVILVTHDPSSDASLLNLRKTMGERINQAIDQSLRAFPELNRKEDVSLTFTIDAYEIGEFGNDLVKVEVPVLYKSPFPFKSYELKINFYLDFYLASKKDIQIAVAGWSYWIEHGFLSKSIESRLKSLAFHVPLLLESMLNGVLHEFNWHQWKDIYLLPGLADHIDRDYEGFISDDCTLVLIPEKN
jgi:hypothetical protein